MATLHMTEAELVKDIVDVLAKVRQGSEVVIELDHRPVAVLKPSAPAGRMISDVIRGIEESGASATVDEDFEKDVQAGIEAHRQPWNPPSWD